ncbi:class I SAM-dependent methyltransferase [Caulobacter segnis]
MNHEIHLPGRPPALSVRHRQSGGAPGADRLPTSKSWWPRYAETLAAWRASFLARRDEAARQFDERFCRMWDYYLAMSEAPSSAWRTSSCSSRRSRAGRTPLRPGTGTMCAGSRRSTSARASDRREAPAGGG